MKKQKGFAPILIILVIVLLIGVFVVIAYKSRAIMLVSQITPLPIESQGSSQTVLPTSSTAPCQIAWINPNLPAKGIIEPLFLKDVSSPNGSGYEGIVRRQIEDDENISVDLVTNFLPDNMAPYYLWAVAVDSNNDVCNFTNLGPLEKNQDVGNWGAGPYTLPIKNVNDDQYFVITYKSFGSNQTDQISNLSDSTIILEGVYKDAKK